MKQLLTFILTMALAACGGSGQSSTMGSSTNSTLSSSSLNSSVVAIPDTYIITVEKRGFGGEINTGPIIAQYGQSLEINFSVDQGYRVAISGCDGEIGDGIYFVSEVHSNCKITALFEPHSNLESPLLIAHAGGGYKNSGYLNSLEAMNANYEFGHRFFELDFNWTSDNQLASIHDWNGTYKRLFPSADHSIAPDLTTFMSLPMLDNQTKVNLNILNQWLINHPNSYIVTDIKDNNVSALILMKEVLGENIRQVIPQIYYIEEFAEVRALGYTNIIFTLYVTTAPTENILDAIEKLDLFAVTISPYKQDFQLIVDRSVEYGKPVYVHTFNEIVDFDKYINLGVRGLYTDFLYPKADGSIGRQ